MTELMQNVQKSSQHNVVLKSVHLATYKHKGKNVYAYLVTITLNLAKYEAATMKYFKMKCKAWNWTGVMLRFIIHLGNTECRLIFGSTTFIFVSCIWFA